MKLPCCFPAGLGDLWLDIEAGGCHMEQVLSYLTLFAMWGHVTKFIINAELIWLPWLTLSDFSLGYICLRGESDCHRAERLFPSSNTFGAVTAELRTLTSKSDPWALEDSKWRHGQKTVSASFCFFLLFLNSDREIACLEFSRLSGEGKEELIVAVLILHKKIVARTCFSVLLVLLCYC